MAENEREVISGGLKTVTRGTLPTELKAELKAEFKVMCQSSLDDWVSANWLRAGVV